MSINIINNKHNLNKINLNKGKQNNTINTQQLFSGITKEYPTEIVYHSTHGNNTQQSID